jgi:hypothetical protein
MGKGNSDDNPVSNDRSTGRCKITAVDKGRRRPSEPILHSRAKHRGYILPIGELDKRSRKTEREHYCVVAQLGWNIDTPEGRD